MSRVVCHSIDLTFENINDMCLFGGLSYGYSGEIKESDLKMLADNISFECPLPPLVFCRETDKRGSVIGYSRQETCCNNQQVCINRSV